MHPLPDGVPPARAVLAANLETALNGVWDAGVQVGDQLGNLGAGRRLQAVLQQRHGGRRLRGQEPAGPVGTRRIRAGQVVPQGLPTLNGVEFAVQQKGSVDGFKLEYFNLDDAVNGVHDAVKGAQNVQQFVDDPKVLAVVGPFNSGVARAEIPKTNRAHLVQISPANTRTSHARLQADTSSMARPADKPARRKPPAPRADTITTVYTTFS